MEIRQLLGHTLSEHFSAETVPAVGVVILIKAINVSGRSKRMGPKGTIFEYAEEEQLAMKKVKQSVTYNRSTCRYKVGVPWKEDRPTLPDNRKAAFSRLRSTEQKLKKDQFIEAEYRETINTYLEKGYIRHVSFNKPPPAEVCTSRTFQ